MSKHSNVKPLQGAGTSQDARHAIIALVAAIFVHRMISALQRNHQAPRPRPCAGVVDGYLVSQRVRRSPGQALNNVQLFAGPAHEASRLVVGRIHD